ncbi:MAG: nucleotidyltransferase domain-containing protein [Oscillospiraceae bacterium]|nr:nucleotidyltransferase domain-containing protein [Oscillospiraceae bacterium]
MVINMITHDEISKAIINTAETFPIKNVSYFGSYADGRQTEASDLDLLIEFQNPAVSLFMLSEIKNNLEAQLKISVDIIHAPLPGDTFLEIGKVVRVYG